MLKVRPSQLLKKTGSPGPGSPVGRSQTLTNLLVFPAYPWDRSSLKSMPLDLRQFEKLDTYASQVGEPGPLPAMVTPTRRLGVSQTRAAKALPRPLLSVS